MSIESDKLMNLADGQVIYNDLRDRIEHGSGAKPITFVLDTVTNTSGAYTHTTTVSAATATMKPIGIEVGNPDAFQGTITVTCDTGAITLSCSSVEGTSTVSVICEEQALNAGQALLTSEEFAVLNGRIGTLSSLQTTAKDNLVAAVNENTTAIGTLSSALSGKVDKSALDDAGIISKTNVTLFNGEFSVTTASSAEWNNPYARASVTGLFDDRYFHKVNFNGTIYVLPVRQWYHLNSLGNAIIQYQYIGNIGLVVDDTSGIPEGIENVPFVILSDYDASASDHIDVLTSDAGTYTFNIEKITVNQKELPKSLIYGDSFELIKLISSSDGKHSLSIGTNDINNNNNYAIGNGNKLSGSHNYAFGIMNKVSGQIGFAVGRDNTVSGNCGVSFGNETIVSGASAFAEGETTTSSGRAAHAEGQTTTASGFCAHAEGQNTTASLDGAHSEGINTVASGAYSHAEGNGSQTSSSATASHAEGKSTTASATYAHAEGRETTASGGNAHSEGRGTTASGGSSHAEGHYTTSSGYASHAEGINTIANHRSQHVFGEYNVADASSAGVADLGNYLEIIGNGTADNARSNARTIDIDGNERIKGNLYVGCNADSTGGTRLPHDVQVNGASVVTNGVANVPVASANDLGVVKTGTASSTGLGVANNNIYVVKASDDRVKAGANSYTPITPANQHNSVFYGLAKASGDTTQSASSNAVGVYTPEAKAAIWNMLGLDGSAFVKSDWELIREDTVTNATEADIEITVDGDGNQFELTDAILLFDLPNVAEASSKTDGRFTFYYTASNGITMTGGAMSRNANGAAVGAWQVIEQRNGMIFAQSGYRATSTNGANMSYRYHETNPSGNGIYLAPNKIIFTRVNIPTVTGTGHYILYGKRKRAALDSPVINVSGTTPSITALPGHRYICGEVSTLTITVPASGCIDVTFTSGSTATVLTVTPTKTGVTAVKWANGFDPTSLDADTTYEINILDGEYGVACSWT